MKTQIQPLPLQAAEQDILVPPDKLSVAQWAEARRWLSDKTTYLSGKWSHEYTPFLIEIMESLSDAVTRQVDLMKCSQAAGTEGGLNFMGRTIEQDPGPTLVVMPTENDVKRRMATRIRPMFESTPSLLGHLPGGRADSLNIGKETILDNMILYIAWAGSPSALADNPIRYIILDEVGKFPVKSGKEADPVSLAKKRLRTFYSVSKLYCPSTPVLKGDLIDREFEAGDKRRWWARCPHCKKYHVLKWANVQLDKDKQGNLLGPRQYESGGYSRYLCPKCKRPWTEQQRWQAVSAGRWAPDGITVLDDGSLSRQPEVVSHRSYHITALMLYPGFQTVDDLAAEWSAAKLAQKAGDIGPLQDFINSQLAEPWVERKKQTDIDRLTSRLGGYEYGTVPAGVAMLTTGLDVQLDHIWVTVIGWGYMSQAWLISAERIETGDTSNLDNYKLVRQFINFGWPIVGTENQMFAAKVAIDCNYRPDTVLDFCRSVNEQDIIPVRGDDTVKTRPFRATKTSDGLSIRYDLNVNILKDRLYRLLFESKVPGPGYFHLPKNVPQYVLEHLCSEEQRTVRTGRRTSITWMLKTAHTPNHIWDCCVYAAFAAELAGARTLADPAMLEQLKKQRDQQQQKSRRGGGFLDDLPEIRL